MSGSSLPTTIKGVAPSRAGPGRISYLPDSGDAPRQEDVVGALDVSEPRKPGLKAKLYDEMRRFLMIFAYLWIVFFVFLVHEWIVLADNHIGFRFYGLAVINALVLSKIMLIAEGLRFGERFDDKPLIIPILYKSVLFSVLLVVAYILEEIGLGWFHGKSVAESLPQIGGGGVVGTLCVTALLCIARPVFCVQGDRSRHRRDRVPLAHARSCQARAGRQDHSRGISAYVTEAAVAGLDPPQVRPIIKRRNA